MFNQNRFSQGCFVNKNFVFDLLNWLGLFQLNTQNKTGLQPVSRPVE